MTLYLSADFVIGIILGLTTSCTISYIEMKIKEYNYSKTKKLNIDKNKKESK